MNKLPRKIPICIEDEVCLNSLPPGDMEREEERLVSLHRSLGHKIEYSDCFHPFLKGITDKLSMYYLCICECEKCLENHQRHPEQISQ